jgi:hypothetical protein
MPGPLHGQSSRQENPAPGWICGVLAGVGLTVEARDAEHAEEIRKALEAAGFKLKG